MSTLSVAGVQLDIAWENPEANFRSAERWAEGAAAGGAQMVVLPEMFATGFSMAAERVAPHGPAIRAFLGDLARRLQIWVVGGYAEPGETSSHRPRNACSILDPQGEEILRYHKLHPFSLAREHEHYDGGDALPTVTVEGVRITPLICYDLRFPEPFRIAADGTDLFVVIANWPDPRVAAWSALLTARAIENQAYVLGVNRCGDAEGLPHRGHSALLDPLGRTLVERVEQPGLVTGEVSAPAVAAIRERFGFLADRRPDVYRRLTDRRK
jgi:predicted amidohydrolase